MAAAPEPVARRILHAVVHIDRSKLAVRQGVRLGAGIGACLLFGVITGRIATGAALSLGAVGAGFADLGGAYLGRLRTMGLASAMMALGAFLGSVTGDSDVAAIAVMAGVGFCGAMAMAVSVPASFIGLQATLGVILTSGVPADAVDSLERAALVLAGGAWQTLLAVGLWPVRPTKPERDAVARVYRTLAGTPREPFAPDVAAAMTAADAVLADSVGRAGSHTPLGEGLRGLLVQAQRLSREFAAVEAERERMAAAGDPGARDVADAVEAAAGALAEQADRLTAGRPADDRDSGPPTRGATAASGLAAPGSTDAARRGREAAARLAALRGQVRGAADLVTACSRHWAGGAGAGGASAARSDRAAHRPWAIVRANLTFASPVFRHAVRLGSALAAGVAIGRIADLPRGYWVPLTVLFVLRPDYGTTLSRGAARYVGTALGVVVATVITIVLGPGDYGLVVLATVFAVGLYAFFYANYALFTASITAMIVFVVAFTGIDEMVAVVDRVIDTAIGGALAVLAYVVWPTWERRQVPENVAALLEADRGYAAAVLAAVVDPASGSERDVRTARRAARLARTNAEASIDRFLSEPGRGAADADRALGLLAASRRYAGAVLALESRFDDRRRAGEPAAAAFAAQADAALAAIASAERSGTPPDTLPPLRATQATLAAGRGAEDLLVQASDRMVDALNAMGHLAGGPDPAGVSAAAAAAPEGTVPAGATPPPAAG